MKQPLKTLVKYLLLYVILWGILFVFQYIGSQILFEATVVDCIIISAAMSFGFVVLEIINEKFYLFKR